MNGTKHKYGVLKKMFILLLILAVIGLGVDALVVCSSANNIIFEIPGRLIGSEDLEEMPAMAPADCVMVLGCGIIDEDTPSDMLKDRLDMGIAAYQSGLAPRILLSGDNGQDSYNEIHVMLHYVLNAGVPEEDIFCDHAGFSTYDSVHRAGSIFGVKDAIIVTQRYHMFRALFIAKGLGIDAKGVCANQRSYMGQLYREAREILARDKDCIKTLIKAEPELGGEQISLLGSSKLSWEESELK